MKVQALLEEFKRKGFVKINDFFPVHLDLIQRESIAKYTNGYKMDSAPGRSYTSHHCTDLEDTFTLKLLFGDRRFRNFIRLLTGIDDLEMVHRDPSEPYEANLYSSKLELYQSGGKGMGGHYDRMVFPGDQIAVVYTVLSKGGAPMQIHMRSREGDVVHEDNFDLFPDTLTIHDANRVYHEVIKPDPKTTRIAYLLQFTNKGKKPKTGPAKTMSHLTALMRSGAGRLGYTT